MKGSISPEVSIAGSILIDPRCLDDVRKVVTSEMFVLPVCKSIFVAACELQDAGKTIDPVTIRENAEVWDEAFAMQSMEVTLTAANVPVYCELLKKEHQRRAMLGQLRKVEDELSSGGDLMEAASKLILVGESLGGDGDRIVDSYTAANELIESILRSESGYNAFIPTGFKEIDSILGGGMIRDGLYILAARPGCGKTAFAIAMAEKMLQKGTRILFISLEMSRVQLMARRIASIVGKVTASQIMKGDMTEEEYKLVADTCKNLSATPMFFNRMSSLNVSEIQFLAKQTKADVVIIDYLGLLQYENGKSLYERVTATSNRLKRMARTLEVPVLCLAQLNREVEGRKTGPMLSDLRDSGAIEQDADGVLLIHKSFTNEDDVHAPALVELTIAKNRHGGTGKLEFSWYLRNGRILEIMKKYR